VSRASDGRLWVDARLAWQHCARFARTHPDRAVLTAGPSSPSVAGLTLAPEVLADDSHPDPEQPER